MSDVIETLRKIKGRAFYSGRADLPYTEEAREVERAMVEAITEIERLRAELTEHTRRAALVAQWAEGLRAGKRYAVTTMPTDRPVSPAYEGDTVWMWHDPDDGLVFTEDVTARFGECVIPLTTDPARAAAYMLAVSDQWTEVEP